MAAEKDKKHVMTDEQYDSVIAGLRLLQCRVSGNGDLTWQELDAIRTNEGEHGGLDSVEIEELIADLQFHEITELPK